jgi:uncharacterized protein (AIM24 family)
MTMTRPTKNYLGRFTSGEEFLRVFEGSGRLILNPAPYWRYRIMKEMNGDSASIVKTLN